MSSVHAITNAARHAHTGLNHALRQVDDVARTVAAGVGTSGGKERTFAEQFAALSQMPRISYQARANLRVLEVIDDLDAELLWRRRR